MGDNLLDLKYGKKGEKVALPLPCSICVCDNGKLRMHLSKPDVKVNGIGSRQLVLEIFVWSLIPGQFPLNVPLQVQFPPKRISGPFQTFFFFFTVSNKAKAGFEMTSSWKQGKTCTCSVLLTLPFPSMYGKHCKIQHFLHAAHVEVHASFTTCLQIPWNLRFSPSLCTMQYLRQKGTFHALGNCVVLRHCSSCCAQSCKAVGCS